MPGKFKLVQVRRG